MVADAENLLAEGRLTDPIKMAAAEELIQRFTSAEFVRQKLTTVEDIQTANRLIDTIIGLKPKEVIVKA